MKRVLQNLLTLAALCGLFSQPTVSFAQMPGTFQPLTAVAAAAGVQDCIGGTVTYSGGKTIHTFTTVGNSDFFCSSPHTVSYLVVAGGGSGGGYYYAGGGGAGGMLTGTTTMPAGTSTITVGAGGLSVSAARGGNGGNSSIMTPGGAGSWWTIMPTITNTATGSGYSTSDLRSRYTAAVFNAAVPSGTQIRVTISGGAAGANSFTSLYCGATASNGGTQPLNYDGSQVQIKFGGNASATVPATASPLVSDAVNYSWDKTKDFMCSVQWTSASFAGNSSGLTGSLVYGGYATGGTSSATVMSPVTSGPTVNYNYGPVSQIEAFSSFTLIANAIGGGAGGSYSSNVPGLSGGSGGGGAYGATSAQVAAGTAGQGNAGGANGGTCGNGGGGAGAVGVSCTTGNGSAGGAGLASSISGASVTYAGGGGGGSYSGLGGVGGAGGGGTGENYTPTGPCTSGAANTGGGGGGKYGTAVGGCDGGSGIVIVSYPSGTPNPNCVGGTITTVGANTVHTFTSNGTINCVTGKSVNYLVVAGGGGGGGGSGGGGGAGGALSGTGLYVPGGLPQAVTVGNGGSGASGNVNGTNGGGSNFAGVSTTGGGGGGAASVAGNAGGSGGGGNNAAAGGTGVSGQGFAGGGSTANASGGGGGATAVGVTPTSPQNGGNGGPGLTSSISGASVCYAGGGGGGFATAGGGTATGTATCGGASGPTVANSDGIAAVANRGGGGSGPYNNGTVRNGGNGGSGIVIVSYATGSTQPPPPCTANTQGGGTFANVMGLWHLDNNLTDSTGKGHNLTITGTGSLSSVQSKFGGYSFLNATAATGANWLVVPPAGSADFVPRTGDWTVEMWVYQTVAGGAFWGNNNTAFGGDWSIFSAATSVTMYIGGNTGIPAWTYTPTLNQWNHWAFTRASGTVHIFVNGTEVPSAASAAGDINPGASYSPIIGNYAAQSSSMVGYIDEVRVSNVARYTANFTPPSQAFCNF